MTQSIDQTENRQTDRYLSEPILRTYLGYSPSTIRRLRRKGLPSVGTDRLRRYHLGAVLQWLEEHT
jgi:predicted DNA-binding transcriptional regulator AlpA